MDRRSRFPQTRFRTEDVHAAHFWMLSDQFHLSLERNCRSDACFAPAKKLFLSPELSASNRKPRPHILSPPSTQNTVLNPEPLHHWTICPFKGALGLGRRSRLSLAELRA